MTVRMHRNTLDPMAYEGFGGFPKRDAFKGQSPLKLAQCRPYGGACLADGCVHWFPLPSPQGCQEATCGLVRAEQPIHLKEAERKAKSGLRYANEIVRLGWYRSAQVAYQRAWAWQVAVQQIEGSAAPVGA